jgi:hypothetical protein
MLLGTRSHLLRLRPTFSEDERYDGPDIADCGKSRCGFDIADFRFESRGRSFIEGWRTPSTDWTEVSGRKPQCPRGVASHDVKHSVISAAAKAEEAHQEQKEAQTLKEETWTKSTLV